MKRCQLFRLKLELVWRSYRPYLLGGLHRLVGWINTTTFKMAGNVEPEMALGSILLSHLNMKYAACDLSLLAGS